MSSVVAPDPRKLFEPDRTYERPLLSQVTMPIGCAFLGVLCALTINYCTWRPLLSGKFINTKFVLFLCNKYYDLCTVEYIIS